MKLTMRQGGRTYSISLTQKNTWIELTTEESGRKDTYVLTPKDALALRSALFELADRASSPDGGSVDGGAR